MSHAEHDFDIETVPEWCIAPFRRYFDAIDAESKYLHLSMEGLSRLQVLPQVSELLIKLSRESDDLKEVDLHQRRLEGAKEASSWSKTESECGFPLLHRHCVVGMWSALEAMCEDVAIAWLANYPQAWHIQEVQSLKISVKDCREADTESLASLVVSRLDKTNGGPLASGVGRLTSLLGVFGLKPNVGENLRRSIHELGATRNLVVHRGAIVDARFRGLCPWIELKEGATHDINHILFSWYFQGAKRYAERVMNQTFFKLSGKYLCNCPGMHDIGERPDGADHAETA